jgi:hypothetical protein
MTPKEKAQELVDKFKEIIPAQYDQIDGGYDLLNLEFNARDCARLAVDEIIASNPIAFDEDDNCIAKQWWQEVKQEIELL